MTQDEMQVWRDAVERARRAADDWRSFSVFWCAMAVISFGAFLIEMARHTK
ncbi:MAG: hypothetical protein V4641_09885 [Pseudomonadota bacterium]